MWAVLALLPPITLADQRARCWDEAEERYGVSSELLFAIAKVESRLNPSAIGKNPNGTYDIGLMQINSSWLPKLKRYGITKKDLLDGCTSIHVGAWILSDNIARHGLSWTAIGAYNAKTEWKRARYANLVYKELRRGIE